MKRKIILGLGAVAIVIAGIASFSAWEAHIINVTAHIENALSVETEALDFGTVFPQEYLEKSFTIALSKSFMEEGDADDVNYVINQKTKCKLAPDYTGSETLPMYAAVNYWANAEGVHECPEFYLPMLSLCPFLSKMPVPEAGEYNDTGVPSYFISYQEGCMPRYDQTAHQAVGKLAKSQQDTVDTWTVDLKVPPVKGYVGQDWPASCAEWTVEKDSQDYGCDLWIEVTGISRAPKPEEGNTVLSLENKDPDGWFIEVDNIYGVLEFDPCLVPFTFTLTANGLMAETDYSLIYYADPWPGSNPGALIWNGMTDAQGKINVSDEKDLGISLPTSPDTNTTGAKIWLVPSNDYTYPGMTAWNPLNYLYEYNVVNYLNDTVCPK